MDTESELEALRARCTRLERSVVAVLALLKAAGYSVALLRECEVSAAAVLAVEEVEAVGRD